MSESCKGNKIAIVVAQEFEDVELLYPIIRLSEEGAEISVVPIQEELHTRLTDDNYYSSPHGQYKIRIEQFPRLKKNLQNATI